MGIVIMVGQLLLALSILVGLHEGGHMIAAKLFGMRVEKFSIGFPPKLFGFQKGETYYMLGMISLGGFVKISGMIDESMDKEQMAKPPEPHEFRSKPAWQRLIVMLAGIIVNVVFGILFFAISFAIWGETYIKAHEAKKGIWASEQAKELGLKSGDKVLDLNGKPFEKFDDLESVSVLLEEKNPYYTIQRGDSTIKVELPPDILEYVSEARDKQGFFIRPIAKFAIDSVLKDTPADKGGLQKGDSILALNNQEIAYYHDLEKYMKGRKNEVIQVKVKSGTEIDTLKIKVDSLGKFGFAPDMSMPDTGRINYSFTEAIPKGVEAGFGSIWSQVLAFKKIFSGELNAQKTMGGPVVIATHFGSKWVWERFWKLTAMISMILAFMNLLPIPALDGGHVMFLLYEIVAGRKPGDKFMERAQQIGMIFLLALMALILLNDTIKQFF